MTSANVEGGNDVNDSARGRRTPRIGLVLGAGGVVGASYLAGALEGVRRATGFEPWNAEVVVGTSAGAFIGAINAVGVPVSLVYAKCTGEHPAGERFTPAQLALSDAMDRHNEGHWTSRYLPALTLGALPRPLFQSPRLALSAMRAKGTARYSMLATALLNEGVLSSQRSIGAVVRTAFAGGWPSRAEAAKMWVVACDLDAGERVVFGRDGAPDADLDVAVSAATAIPGLFAPVRIGGRRYCDAGLGSPSNLDVVAGLGLDAVLCINPLSGGAEPLATDGGHGPRATMRRAFERFDRFTRSHVDAWLEAERRVVEARDRGTRVFMLHPTAEDLAAFPMNSMDLGARATVMRTAATTTAATLSRADGELGALATLLRAARADRDAA